MKRFLRGQQLRGQRDCRQDVLRARVSTRRHRRSPSRSPPSFGGRAETSDDTAAPLPPQLVNDVTNEVSTGSTLAESFERALALVDGRLGAPRAALILADGSQRVLAIEAAHGMPCDALRLRYGAGVVGRVAEKLHAHRHPGRARRADGALGADRAVGLARSPAQPRLRSPHRRAPVCGGPVGLLCPRCFFAVPHGAERRSAGCGCTGQCVAPPARDPGHRGSANGESGRVLRIREHGRRQRRDAPGVRGDRAGRAHDCDRAHPRRVRNGKGARRASDSRELGPVGGAVHQDQQRGLPRDALRGRAVRPRARRLHRRRRSRPSARSRVPNKGTLFLDEIGDLPHPLR